MRCGVCANVGGAAPTHCEGCGDSTQPAAPAANAVLAPKPVAVASVADPSTLLPRLRGLWHSLLHTSEGRSRSIDLCCCVCIAIPIRIRVCGLLFLPE